MKVEVIMPKMGESINEGTIVKWYKKIGDKVKKDEIIYEITTDKVDTEIPSPVDGTLIEIKAYELETVPINEVVAIIETDSDAAVNEITKNDEIPSTDQVGTEIEIPMPKMGESITEGTIIKWHKKVGDEVKRDEIIYEISTDKVDTEVPSPVDGIITEILFPENETVEVGVTIAKIATKSGFVKNEKSDEKEEPKHAPKEVEQTQKAESKKIKIESSNKFFSPVVLNIAAKEGVTQKELEAIEGSGINGRVTKKDILNYIKNRGVHVTTSAPDIVSDSSPAFAQKTETIPMDNIRKRIMEHMIKSRDTSVHVSEIMEVDMTKIYNFLKINKEK